MRVSDLELALSSGTNSATRPAQPTGQAAVSPEGPSGNESASAEAIGALVRVSDGAVLWNEQTRATMTEQAGNARLDKARRHMAADAVRFALLQLERRFRQYRLRFQ